MVLETLCEKQRPTILFGGSNWKSVTARVLSSKGNKEKYFDTPDNPKRQSAEKVESQKKIPSFVPGYANGQPIYTNIRIIPQEAIARIEDEIALQESRNVHRVLVKYLYLNKTADFSLV
ncbi:hypothetical protein HDV01_000463 [Terramyces sp. JEL0728]|nr:hypothetical protein HDV01_000463 [Terramyces sp. JEL0728]